MRDGKIVSLNYGCMTSLALDPIEKKPLAQFHSGSSILSIGSFGCNFHCDFCQNAIISQENHVEYEKTDTRRSRKSSFAFSR